MRKGDSHLELLIYLVPILSRQSPGRVPCWARHRAPWPAVLPWFWPWQRSPLCCLTRNLPGYYQVCDLSMCGSLTRLSATLCLGRCWNTPVYPLIVCPSMGQEEGGRGGGDTWIRGWGGGSMATKKLDLGTGNCFNAKNGGRRGPAASKCDRRLLSDSDIFLLAAEQELHHLLWCHRCSICISIINILSV